MNQRLNRCLGRQDGIFLFLSTCHSDSLANTHHHHFRESLTIIRNAHVTWGCQFSLRSIHCDTLSSHNNKKFNILKRVWFFCPEWKEMLNHRPIMTMQNVHLKWSGFFKKFPGFAVKKLPKILQENETSLHNGCFCHIDDCVCAINTKLDKWMKSRSINGSCTWQLTRTSMFLGSVSLKNSCWKQTLADCCLQALFVSFLEVLGWPAWKLDAGLGSSAPQGSSYILNDMMDSYCMELELMMRSWMFLGKL